MMSVSIIIPAWNEEKSLRATLESLLEIDYDKSKCEIIVVAGGVDHTYEIARQLSTAMDIFSRYIVISQRPDGKNAAILDALNEAEKEIIVILDADTLVSKQWLKCMVEPIELGNCELTLANPEPMIKNWISDFYMIRKVFIFKHHRSRLFGNLDWGICPGQGAIAMKASTIKGQENWLFDSEIKVGVDYLLINRSSILGDRVMYIEEASVMTHLPSSLKYFISVELRWLTGLLNISGVNSKELLATIIVIGALAFTVPVSKILFIFSAVFNSLYVAKKSHMFLIAKRFYRTDLRNIFGFIFLSYAYHLLRAMAHVKYFLRFSKGSHLHQGQRY